MKRYTKLYDDPYKVLVGALVSKMSVPELQRLLHDTQFVKAMLRKEIRSLDFRGPYLDCLVVDIYEHGKRMEMMSHLEQDVDYFFSKLDLNRLRHEVAIFLEDHDIEIQ